MANIKISELNEIIKKSYDDVIPIVDVSADETKKIKVEDLVITGVSLLAVDSSAPEECETDDKYYNTEDNLIYTAIDTDTWGTTGENPIEGIMYVVFETQTVYAYNGETLIIIGSSSGSVTNEYSTSTTEGYSANYINNRIVNTYNTNQNDTYSCNYINWKLVNNVTARTYIDIPNNAKEVRMITYVGDVYYTCDLLVERLSTTYKYVKLGSSTDYVQYEYNGTGIRCVQAYVNSTSAINDTITYMYYK